MSAGHPFVVAIDGPAGAGKSTAAKALASRLGFAFLDTGAIYRTVALMARRRGLDWSDGPALGALAERLDVRFLPEGGINRVIADGEDVSTAIRTPEMSDGASRVSALPPVRAALLALQRRLASAGNLVAEGRDMGTVVFPDAAAKFFLTATAAERARRRAAELAASGRPTPIEVVLADIEERDDRDRNRAVSPLRKADDAIEIDSEGMNADQVVERMLGVIAALRARRG
jgi:cytidylate kinase